MKCFYHNDPDGKASAFCVHAWVGLTDQYDTEYFPIDYNQNFPIDDIHEGEQIWIVDFSIQPDEMRALLKKTDDVTWIDHHKTAIAKYEDFEHEIRGVRLDGEAGCTLTYKYIHWWTGRGAGPIELQHDRSGIHPVPRCLVLIGDRDVWAWEHGDETKYFHAGHLMYDSSPESEFWWKCMDHECPESTDPKNTGNADARIRGNKFWEQVMDKGRTVVQYRDRFHKELNDAIGFDLEFEGYKTRALNICRVGSEAFGGDPAFEDYEILMPFSFNGEKFTVSMYSAGSPDVSEIAVRHGGGGHQRAAGFVCDSLPFATNTTSDAGSVK